jgi:hypothetical protein
MQALHSYMDILSILCAGRCLILKSAQTNAEDAYIGVKGLQCLIQDFKEEWQTLT